MKRERKSWKLQEMCDSVPIVPTYLYAKEFRDINGSRYLGSTTTSQPALTPAFSTVFSFFENNTMAIEESVPSSTARTSGISGTVSPPVTEANAAHGNNCFQATEFLKEENIWVGVLFASKALMQLLVNPFMGPLTNRIGYHIPMFAGFVIMFISTVMFAFSGTYTLLFVARTLQGIGSSFSSVAGLGMLACVYTDDHERGRAMGIALGGLALGVLVGAPFGSVTYVFLGKTVPFLILAFLALLDGALQLCILQPSKVSPEVPLAHDIFGLIGPNAGLGISIGPSTGGAIVRAIGFPWLTVIIGVTNILYAPLCYYLRSPPAKEEKLAVLSQDCPMETRMYAAEKHTRQFPLGEDSDEEPGCEE